MGYEFYYELLPESLDVYQIDIWRWECHIHIVYKHAPMMLTYFI